METNDTNIENKQEKGQQLGYCLSVSGSLSVSSVGTGCSYNMNIWSSPIEVGHEIFDNRIEFIYKQEKMIWPGYSAQETKIYKIIYTCKNGQWFKSEPIYGKIIAPQEERYEFED